ncbi:MAG: D-alanine--D-alanine ligase [Lentimicrobiaceae bacterium]|nr:D-alanine--D-alanine ligase [Lentimicrobiaceae bacterium]MCB9023785.1 D-alanine--D-alanine ligase [Lentimicrobiaceae bacterium]MCO5265284.1 D-alanine--D-alanine ligase [Lentimicrobium sp.]
MKKNIALLTGGYSEEFDISVKSGKVIASQLDNELFNTYQITINRDRWVYTTEQGKEYNIDLNDFSLRLPDAVIHFDAAFIGIHGTPGEDGKLQGYLDMMHVPYNTCGRVTSSLTFNKFFCNGFVSNLGINVAKTFYLHRRDRINEDEILKYTGLPCFVKPNSNGSSIGISKVKEAGELQAAISKSFEVDDETLVQEFIPGAEITCGIYEKDGKLNILPLTLVVSHKEWFDYEAKYTDGMADEISPAPIDEKLAIQCREISAMLYRKLNCKGIVRIDYILTPETFPGGQQFYFLEVNTIPGLSEASIVPRQAASVGISLKQLFTDVMNETLNNY